MPTPKKHANAAEKQAAYRRRYAVQVQSKPIPTVPGYRRWKAMRSKCLSILDMAISEMELYFDQRSDVWHDSGPAEAFAEIMDSMAEVAATLRELDS